MHPEIDPQSTDRQSAGRILKVKRGYNPNSSSMGSELSAFYAFPKAMLVVPVIFGTAAAAIAAAFGSRRERKEAHSDVQEGDSDSRTPDAEP